MFDPGDEDRRDTDYIPIAARLHAIAIGPSRNWRLASGGYISTCNTLVHERETAIPELVTCPYCIHAMLPVTSVGPVDPARVADARLRQR